MLVLTILLTPATFPHCCFAVLQIQTYITLQVFFYCILYSEFFFRGSDFHGLVAIHEIFPLEICSSINSIV